MLVQQFALHVTANPGGTLRRIGSRQAAWMMRVTMLLKALILGMWEWQIMVVKVVIGHILRGQANGCLNTSRRTPVINATMVRSPTRTGMFNRNFRRRRIATRFTPRRRFTTRLKVQRLCPTEYRRLPLAWRDMPNVSTATILTQLTH